MSTKNEFLDLNKYKKDAKIGQGAFGKVFKVIEISTGEVFAAKISMLEIDEDQNSIILNLSREVNIISQLNHPSILKFIGYSPIDFNNMPKPVIITEYSANGSLENIIELERKSLSPQSWDDTKKLINIYGIASAMLYLHSHNIIHRDLKAANILEDDYLFPKIADFGLSKKFHQNQNTMSLQSTAGPRGTPVYMAPEIWSSYEYTKAGDVYAFSYIMYEILTLEQPFKGLTDLQLMKKVVIDGNRPEFQYQIPVCYQNLITKCWSTDPSERPTFEYIVDQLKNNEEFITNSIDRSEYYDYIDLIDNYSISFEPNKKFNKITVLKEKVLEIEEKINEKEIDHEEPVFFNQNEFIQLPDEIKKIFKESLINDECKSIVFQFNNVVLLYTKKVLNSKIFVKILTNLDKIVFELKYPSNHFDEIHRIVSYLSTILKTINIHFFISDTTNIHNILGTSSIPLPSNLTSMFSRNEQVSTTSSISITLEPSITLINSFLFNGCSSLTEIEIPSSVTTIGVHSFNGCSSLKHIEIPSSVRWIEDYAFMDCSSLEQINIPSTVVSIKKGAFSNCTSLKQITISLQLQQLKRNYFIIVNHL